MHLKKNIGLGLAFLLLLVIPGCMKDESGFPMDTGGDGLVVIGDPQIAVASLRMQDGWHYLQLDESDAVYIYNQQDLSSYGDAIRVLVQYVEVGGYTSPSAYDRVVYINWIELLEQGETEAGAADDPVDIVVDWITSVEDGFLTLHYQIEATGKVQHRFSIGRDDAPYGLLLRHDADGDMDGVLTEGIVWFPLSGLLPDTEGETVELTLRYQALDGQEKMLTFDYRTRK